MQHVWIKPLALENYPIFGVVLQLQDNSFVSDTENLRDGDDMLY